MQFLKTIRQLAAAYQAFESMSDKKIRTYGLTPAQFDVIATLGNQPPMTCKELAEKTLMVKANLTVVLDGLSKKNLISKTTNPEDGRSLIIALTEDGIAKFNATFFSHLKYIEPLAEMFSDKDLSKLTKHLNKFTEKVNLFIEETKRG